MSDDSFIREVEEELRNEQLQNFWSRYGKWLIGVALVIVVGTGAFRYYEWNEANKAALEGGSFMEAVRLAESGKTEEANKALAKLGADGSLAYRASAKLRQAAEQAKAGELEQALATYDALIADGSVDTNFRDIARIRAAMILVDTGTVDDVEKRVSALAGPGAPYRASAREAIGLAKHKAGDLKGAFEQFDAVQKDEGTPNGLRQRARMMLELIASQGGPVQE